MKMVCKVILTAAAIAALAAPAIAADKLVVKHSSGSGDAFKVTDGGQVFGYQVDAGLTDVAEQSRIERSSTGTTAAGFGVKNSTYLKVGASTIGAVELETKIAAATATTEKATYTIRKLTEGSLRDSLVITDQPVFNRYLPAGSWNATQAAASFALKKGNGTLANGTGPRMAFISEDASTTTNLLVGSISFPVDFTNKTSNLAFTVRSGSSDTFATAEVLKVTYDGKLGVGMAAGTLPNTALIVKNIPGPYDTPAAATTAGLVSGAFYRTSSNVVMIVP